MRGLADVPAVVTRFEFGDLRLKALDSIRAQGPIRIVSVDDGSASCACRDREKSHETVLRVDRDNGGLSAALNTGVALVPKVRDEWQAPVGTIDVPATCLLGATTGLMRAVRQVGPFAEHSGSHCIVAWWSRADRVGLVRVDDADPVLLWRIVEWNSVVIHCVEARRDLLHHVHTHVVRRAAS